MAQENPPPKMLGGLMAALGFVLAVAGLQLSDIEGGGSYFVTVGILLAITGALLYLGKKSALFAYGVTLAVVWLWSWKDANGDMSVLVPRVGLLTLLAFYIYSFRVRSRLY